MNASTYPSKRPSRGSVFLFIVHSVLIAAMGIGYLYSFVTFKLESRDFIERHHWNLEPAHDLPLLIDFKKGGNASMFTLGDWSGAEDWGTWTDGAHAKLKVKVGSGYNGKTLSARVTLYYCHLPKSGKVDVYYNRKRLDTWRFSGFESGEVREIEFMIPDSSDTLEFEFRIHGAHAPNRQDRRILGIGLEEILLRETPAS